MNINNLKENKTLKSYKHLCEVLEVSVKTGNSKKSQIKEMERYFKSHKDGNKIIVDEIYRIAKPKEDDRVKSGSVYGEDVQKLILDLLSQDENEGHLFLSCNQILFKLQMVNSNYSTGRNNIPRLSEIIKVDEKIIKDVYDFTHNKLKLVLESSLNVLTKQSWIEWHKKKTVCINKVIIDTNALGQPRLDSNNNICSMVVNEYREATLEEVQYIIEQEGLLLDEYGCRDKRDLIIKCKMDDFRLEINKRLKSDCNIEFYYESYEIISNKSALVERLGRIEKANTYNSLNKKVMESSKKSIERKHINAVEKINGNPSIHELDSCHIRANKEYVNSSNLIVEKIINRKARKIGTFNKNK